MPTTRRLACSHRETARQKRLACGRTGTAKLNGFNPQTYLTYVLERIAEHPINRVSELLPWNISLNHTDHREAA